MELAKIEINDFGGAPVAEHNMPCPVCSMKPAVLILNTGTFMPCRGCQEKGWRTLKTNWLTRWLLHVDS